MVLAVVRSHPEAKVHVHENARDGLVDKGKQEKP